MNDTNKTILYGIAMFCITLTIISGFYVFTRPDNIIIQDKFTHCLQVAMSESRQSGKVIDIEKAKEVCLNIDNLKKNS